MKTRKVVVVPYDEAWGSAFEAIKKEIEEALGTSVLRIEHVGSTAVRGLSAKPCIDLDAVVKDDSVLGEVIVKLAEIGYIHEGDLGIKGREAFCYSGKPHLMKHHLYVCAEDSEELRRHLVFRDYLRSNPQAVRKYSAVKEEGARLFPYDIDGYIRHKTPCIEEFYTLCGLK